MEWFLKKVLNFPFKSSREMWENMLYPVYEPLLDMKLQIAILGGYIQYSKMIGMTFLRESMGNNIQFRS